MSCAILGCHHRHSKFERQEIEENPGKLNYLEIILASILECLQKLELKNIDTDVGKTEKSTNQFPAAEQTTLSSMKSKLEPTRHTRI